MSFNFGFEHGHACAFGSDQGARHVESVLRQQLIEVVAGDAPGNFGKLRSYQVGISFADIAQRLVNLASRPPWRRMRSTSSSLVAPTVICVPS